MNTVLWMLGRGTGLVALLLLTLSLVLGIVTRSRRTLAGLPRYGVTAVHQTASLTATTLITIHVISLLLDPEAPLRLLDALLPFTGTWRPLWVGLGTLSLDLLAAIVVSALLRKRIGHRTFRAIHWSSYALWPTAFLHALGTGTDAGTLWFRGAAVACLAVVGGAVAWRTSSGFLLTTRPVSPRSALPTG